jgi:hypothetical protein
MSSLDSKGENEFYDDESNIVGKSGDSIEEENNKISNQIKKEIRKNSDSLTNEKS